MNMVHVDQESEKKMVDGVIVTPVRFVTMPENVEEKDENQMIIKQSKWKVVKEGRHQILPPVTKGEIKLADILNELKKFSIDEEIQKSEKVSIHNSTTWIKVSRQFFHNQLSQPKFHYCIITLVIIDLMIVLVDLVLAQLSTPCLTPDEMESYNTTDQRDSCLLPYSSALSRGELFLFYFSLLLLIIFVSEVLISFYAFGWKHYKNPLYLIDSSIVFASFIMELYFHYGNIGRAGRAAAAIVILRLWKIVRAIHAVAHTITVKNRLLIKKIQEAQISIEEDKLNTEKMLEKQEIKVEYLMNSLKAIGKLPSLEQIDKYVDKTWERRKNTV